MRTLTLWITSVVAVGMAVAEMNYPLNDAQENHYEVKIDSHKNCCTITVKQIYESSQKYYFI